MNKWQVNIKIWQLSQHEDLTRRHKDLTSQHNYLTSDGRSMPPYASVQKPKCISFYVAFRIETRPLLHRRRLLFPQDKRSMTDHMCLSDDAVVGDRIQNLGLRSELMAFKFKFCSPSWQCWCLHASFLSSGR